LPAAPSPGRGIGQSHGRSTATCGSDRNIIQEPGRTSQRAGGNQKWRRNPFRRSTGVCLLFHRAGGEDAPRQGRYLSITFPVISRRQGFPSHERLLSPPPLGGPLAGESGPAGPGECIAARRGVYSRKGGKHGNLHQLARDGIRADSGRRVVFHGQRPGAGS
jgi:hypothetical protein